jgi:hypothetical protein
LDPIVRWKDLKRSFNNAKKVAVLYPVGFAFWRLWIVTIKREYQPIEAPDDEPMGADAS